VKTVFVAVAFVLSLSLLQSCSRPAEEAAITGRWIEWDTPYGSTYDLKLEPDHTFSATVSSLALRCRFPDSISDTRSRGRWTFDRDARRIELSYDAPASGKCKLPELRSIVVDPSGGVTDLLLYPSNVAHPGDPTRLTRARPVPPTLAAPRAQTQVDCFRAHGRWERWCHPKRLPVPRAISRRGQGMHGFLAMRRPVSRRHGVGV
jgi:hypothetical protein